MFIAAAVSDDNNNRKTVWNNIDDANLRKRFRLPLRARYVVGNFLILDNATH
jgi:hypothetical protein